MDAETQATIDPDDFRSVPLRRLRVDHPLHFPIRSEDGNQIHIGQSTTDECPAHQSRFPRHFMIANDLPGFSEGLPHDPTWPLLLRLFVSAKELPPFLGKFCACSAHRIGKHRIDIPGIGGRLLFALGHCFCPIPAEFQELLFARQDRCGLRSAGLRLSAQRSGIFQRLRLLDRLLQGRRRRFTRRGIRGRTPSQHQDAKEKSDPGA